MNESVDAWRSQCTAPEWPINNSCQRRSQLVLIYWLPGSVFPRIWAKTCFLVLFWLQPQV